MTNPQPLPAADPTETAADTPRRAIMNKRLVLLSLGILLGAAAAGVYYGTDWFKPTTPVQKPPDIDPIKDDTPIPVPKVPFTDVTDSAKIRFAHYNGAGGKKLLPET